MNPPVVDPTRYCHPMFSLRGMSKHLSGKMNETEARVQEWTTQRSALAGVSSPEARSDSMKGAGRCLCKQE